MERPERVARRYIINMEVRRASREIQSIRVASEEHRRLVRAWSRPDVLRVVAGLGSIGDSLKQMWEGAKGRLSKFKKILSNSKIVKALSNFLGKVTPDRVKKFLKKGKKKLKEVFNSIRMFLTTPTEVPTLQELVSKTAVGAGIADWFNKNVRPKVQSIEEFLREHMPTVKRITAAAIFTFIWLNVDELSWEWASMVEGFTGKISLPDLIASLPESAMGFLTKIVFGGIGFKVMPLMLAVRIWWLYQHDYMRWENGEWVPNWKKVDREKFEQARV